MLEDIRKRLSLTNNNKLHSYGDGDVRDDSTADWVAEFNEPNDAEFFVHARTDIIDLLSLIDRYKKALEEITRGYGFDGYRINCIVKEALEKE